MRAMTSDFTLRRASDSEMIEQSGMDGLCQSYREGNCRARPRIGALGGGEDAGGGSRSDVGSEGVLGSDR